jgi:glycosyltransferase involved in cell wall biosynthesis
MLTLHRLVGTWRNAIDTYIVMSEFARTKFVLGGLPEDRLVVKPNFLPDDPGVGAHQAEFALYVGRLSQEKGIQRLLELWHRVQPPIPLRVIGEGPLEHLVKQAGPTVQWLGWQPRDLVLANMRDARLLLFPSECYEGFPLVLLEAMATGLPVIATDRGSVPEIVERGRTGVLVRGGSVNDWEDALRWAIGHPGELTALGRSGRSEFERLYTAEPGYQRLADTYHRTLEQCWRTRGSASA